MAGATPYQDNESGVGPALVLLHPLGGDQQFWDGCRVAWGARRRVVTYDRAGAGKSATPEQFLTQDEQVAELEALRARLGLERIAPVGVAVGAMIAAAYAAAYPARVAALVLSDPTIKIGAAGRALSFERLGKVRAGGIAALLPAIIDKAFHGMPHDVAYHRYFAQFRQNGARGYEMNLLAALELDVSAALPRITSPTLVLVGEHDQLFPPSEAAAVAALIPGARQKTLERASHFPPIQNEAGFIAEVDRFLDAIAADAKRR